MSLSFSLSHEILNVQLILLSCPWGPCRPLGRRQRPLSGQAFPSWSSRPCRPRIWSQGCPLIFCSSRWGENKDGYKEYLENYLKMRIFGKLSVFIPMIGMIVFWYFPNFYDYPFWCIVIYLKTGGKEWKLTLQSGRQVHNSVFCFLTSAWCSQKPEKAWCSQKPGKQQHFTIIKCIFQSHKNSPWPFVITIWIIYNIYGVNFHVELFFHMTILCEAKMTSMMYDKIYNKFWPLSKPNSF